MMFDPTPEQVEAAAQAALQALKDQWPEEDHGAWSDEDMADALDLQRKAQRAALVAAAGAGPKLEKYSDQEKHNPEQRESPLLDRGTALTWRSDEQDQCSGEHRTKPCQQQSDSGTGIPGEVQDNTDAGNNGEEQIIEALVEGHIFCCGSFFCAGAKSGSNFFARPGDGLHVENVGVEQCGESGKYEACGNHSATLLFVICRRCNLAEVERAVAEKARSDLMIELLPVLEEAVSNAYLCQNDRGIGGEWDEEIARTEAALERAEAYRRNEGEKA